MTAAALCDADRAAIEEIWRTQYMRLVRWFCKRGQSHDDACDIASDLIYSIAALGGVSAIENPQAYLFRAAHNLLLNARRRAVNRNTRGHFTLDLVAEHELIAREPAPDSVVAAKDDLAAMLAVLEELPAKTRQVFCLVRFEEMTYSEVAVVIGLTAKSVDYHMCQALKHLRDLRATRERAS